MFGDLRLCRSKNMGVETDVTAVERGIQSIRKPRIIIGSIVKQRRGSRNWYSNGRERQSAVCRSGGYISIIESIEMFGGSFGRRGWC
jgi:hypothetical protein